MSMIYIVHKRKASNALKNKTNSMTGRLMTKAENRRFKTKNGKRLKIMSKTKIKRFKTKKLRNKDNKDQDQVFVSRPKGNAGGHKTEKH